MKILLLICDLILIVIMSACNSKQVVENNTIVVENKVESTYDLNEAIKNAKCVSEYPDTVTIDDFDTVKFGKYEQDGDEGNGKEDIEWVVVDKNNGNAKLMSKYILDNVIYDKESYKWETSNLRHWLNNIFYKDAFDENNSIVEICTIPRKNIEDSIRDKVFCIDNYDIEKYFQGNKLQCIDTCATKYAKNIVNNDSKIWINEGYSEGYSPYWTMIPSGGSWLDIYYIHPGDGLSTGDGTQCGNIGVRPMIVVEYDKINKNIVEENKINSDNEFTTVINDNLDDELKKINNLKLASDLKRGDSIIEFPSIFFGIYEQDDNYENGKEDLEWILLERDEKNKKALLISKYVIENKCYNDYMENELTWENSSLRNFLNTTFFNMTFSNNEKEIIVETENNNNCHIYDPPMASSYGSEYEKSVKDKIFILGYEEIEKYFNEDFALFDDMECTTQSFLTKYADNVKNNGIKINGIEEEKKEYAPCDYWLRDIGRAAEFASICSSDGYGFTNGFLVNKHNIGVRPAMWVKYK